MDPWLDSPRLRTIPVEMLRPGMFVHDLQANWFGHSFWRRRFLIKDEKMVKRLRQDETLRMS